MSPWFYDSNDRGNWHCLFQHADHLWRLARLDGLVGTLKCITPGLHGVGMRVDFSNHRVDAYAEAALALDRRNTN